MIPAESALKGYWNMKTTHRVAMAVLLLVGVGRTIPAAAQGTLEHLESGIRGANGQTFQPLVVPPGQRSYLGAVADDSGGRGVRVLSIRTGGPADQAGLMAQDMVLGAAGRRIRQLSELTTILAGLGPGDKLSLEILRGNRPMHVDVVLGMPPGAADVAGTTPPGLLPPGASPPSWPPPTGLGAGRTEMIPAPPAEPRPATVSPNALLPGPVSADGPALDRPTQPVQPNNSQAQIDDLRRRVDRLERRIQELERELTDSRRK